MRLVEAKVKIKHVSEKNHCRFRYQQCPFASKNLIRQEFGSLYSNIKAVTMGIKDDSKIKHFYKVSLFCIKHS